VRWFLDHSKSTYQGLRFFVYLFLPKLLAFLIQYKLSLPTIFYIFADDFKGSIFQTIETEHYCMPAQCKNKVLFSIFQQKICPQCILLIHQRMKLCPKSKKFKRKKSLFPIILMVNKPSRTAGPFK